MADAKDDRGYWLVRNVVVAGLVLTLCAFVALKAQQNENRQRRYKEYQETRAMRDACGRKVIRGILLAAQMNITREDFTSRFEGTLVEAAPGSGADDASHDGQARHYVFSDPLTRATCNVTFRDDKLIGMNGNAPAMPLPASAAPVFETPEYLLGEKIRTAIVNASVVAWAFAFFAEVVTLTMRRGIRLISTLLIVFATLCMIGWGLSPSYGPTWRAISSNDNLAIGALMIAGSLVLSVAKHRVSGIFSVTGQAHDGAYEAMPFELLQGGPRPVRENRLGTAFVPVAPPQRCPRFPQALTRRGTPPSGPFSTGLPPTRAIFPEFV